MIRSKHKHESIEAQTFRERYKEREKNNITGLTKDKEHNSAANKNYQSRSKF